MGCSGSFECCKPFSGFCSYVNWEIDKGFQVPNVLTDGVPFTLATRLIPETTFNSTASKAALVNATLDAIQSGFFNEIFQVTPIYAAEADGGVTSVTPAWYSSVWHFTLSTQWNYDTTWEEQTAIYGRLSSSIQPLRTLTPEGGAYFVSIFIYLRV